jgi:hypothetical protein
VGRTALTTMRRFAFTLALLFSATLLAQITGVGPKVGETVPDFSLVDQAGTTRTLKSILGPNGAILVFFRSADW